MWIILSIVGFLVIFLIVGKSAGFIGKPPTIQVEVSQAKAIDIIERVSASGMVQPVSEVTISPDVPGELIKIFVEEGDSVQVGDMLIKIRPDNLESALERSQAALNQQRANLAQAEAALASAKAQKIRAEQEYDRNKQLYEDNVISEAEWQVAQANYEIAKNDLTAAEKNVDAARYIVRSSIASVREAEENLGFTNVRAPMGGIVSKLIVEEGERVVGTSQMAGTEMLRIADLTNMEVRVDVNENDIIRVSLGDTAIIDVDSYTYLEKEFKGVVTQIANTANEKTSPDAVTEFEVRIKILNESYADLIKDKNMVSPFRPGMTASVEIVTEKKNEVLSVPLASVTTRNPNDAENEESENEESEENTESAEEEDEQIEVVFINDNGTAKMVAVKTGISDFENIEVKSGISKGQEVISGPFSAVSKRLKDGDLISVQEKKPKQGKRE
ncbi:MAG: efflux RND transporter periplasmic adaptor subunit [Cyclobacteriaceae bacterium]